jgi:hypothetical protein
MMMVVDQSVDYVATPCRKNYFAVSFNRVKSSRMDEKLKSVLIRIL